MAIAMAAMGLQDLFLESFPLNASQKSHYKAWADPFAASTGGNVSFLPSRIDHLYHGRLCDRQYRTRLQWASESGFDPATDLALSEQGLWKLASNRPSWDLRMNGYFERRLEDNDPCEEGSACRANGT